MMQKQGVPQLAQNHDWLQDNSASLRSVAHLAPRFLAAGTMNSWFAATASMVPSSHASLSILHFKRPSVRGTRQNIVCSPHTLVPTSLFNALPVAW